MDAVPKSISQRALASIAKPEPLAPISYPLGRGWYAVYTNIKCEDRVALGLKSKGFDVFLPCETRIRVRRGRKIKLRRPVFSRYVFVAFDPDREEWFHPIKSTDGVESLLENNRIPMRIPTRIIDDLRRTEANGGFDKDKAPQEGEQFRVVNGGPFDGFIGKVKSANASGRIKLLVKLLNGLVPIEFPLADLERTA